MSVIKPWFTPSLSGSGVNCVEVRFVELSDLVEDVQPHGGDQVVAEVRNSKRPGEGSVWFTEAEWNAFLGSTTEFAWPES
ncbi:hypothetical protein JOF56_003949 [Kibdelosporangium banguiense]|uniref:DUF397 domain-containing protein n=1 Tax=Kibdelosporangium banguiense TaxID=1365924 RepID=A0ABS4TGL4_9PSEU|nr:DUF397 domain-containing protein [Kibdelosporangium banguiense]MBP2323564.1 hypothetical protein [Kibdelosporangium banguiense]